MSATDLSAIAVAGGFDNPVFAAQGVFRAVMDATARPGTVHRLPVDVAPPAPLAAGPAALALALCDADTRLWLAPSWSNAETAAWIAFQCGAPLTRDTERADFALAPAGEAPDLKTLSQGSQEYPDRSTTLVVEVAALEGGDEIALSGPGIEGTRMIAPKGLPDGFLAMRAANRLLFPRGVDVILAAGADILALPRTTVPCPKTPEAR
jgi:alpha-D-ribose 1-methylphosphonate 5-triphosphate synthase subunit PhnH